MSARAIGLLLAYMLALCPVYGQANEDLFSRLRGIRSDDGDFYNVDGIEITRQTREVGFSARNMIRWFKPAYVKEKELKVLDSPFGLRALCASKSREATKGIITKTSYYYIEVADRKIIGVSFTSINKTDPALEKMFVRLIIDQAIPDSIFSPLSTDYINFAGRQIALGSGNCAWMGVNNVQCPYYGQMHWSIHKTLDDASRTVADHYVIVKSRKGLKIVSDERVKMVFEGTETIARRVVYDITGLNSLIVGMSGAKQLVVYFVAAAVRNNYVSCVMSSWDRDQINRSGLSPLMEQVMKLK